LIRGAVIIKEVLIFAEWDSVLGNIVELKIPPPLTHDYKNTISLNDFFLDLV
jgi:hypothetical protein